MNRYGVLVILIFVGLCRGGVVAAAPASDIPHLNAMNQPRSFYPFSFGGLENMSVNDAVDLLMSLGYDRILPEGRDASDLVRFEEFLDRSELEGDAFNVDSYYISHKVYNDGYDDSVQKQAIDIMAARGGGTLWVPIRAVNNQADLVDFTLVDNFITGIFEYATGEDGEGNYRNVNIILYPHVNNAYQSTAEAMPLVEEINDPRFTVSINLVHEYHAGLSDSASLTNTFNAAKGHIGAVILCGIETNTFDIVSLEDSELDLEPFMELTQDSEYTGPIAFVNAGMNSPEEYLAGSMTEWEILSTNVGLFAETAAPFVMSTDFDEEGMVLRWNSAMGKFYNLYSSTNLVDWAPHSVGTNTYADIPTSGLGTNALPVLLPSGDQRFFKLKEEVKPSS
jgi:hypothetical protein